VEDKTNEARIAETKKKEQKRKDTERTKERIEEANS